jgi:two-component system response regulator CpxR
MTTVESPQGLTLLLIDDDVELCEMLQMFFQQAGHHLDHVHNGIDGISTALRGAYDLVILDVMLPSIDGFTLLKEIRHRKAVPVIMLTAKARKRERLEGLDAGADDYVAKPFDPDELLARIRAVLRRTTSSIRSQAAYVRIGNLCIDLANREVWVRDHRIDLTELEFDILELMMRTPGQIVSRESITTLLFERQPNSYDRFLDVHISNLRRKLGEDRKLIRTMRGVGYVIASGK